MPLDKAAGRTRTSLHHLSQRSGVMVDPDRRTILASGLAAAAAAGGDTAQAQGSAASPATAPAGARSASGDATSSVDALLNARGREAEGRKALHGINRITRTVTIAPQTRGGIVSGDGIFPFYNRLNIRAVTKGSHTVLGWDGVVGGTMFVGDGVLAMHFDSMTFVGRMNPSSTNRAGYFWKSVYTPSAGSGLQIFRDCSWEDFGTVFKMGEGGTVGGADYTFQKCYCGNVDTFLELTNHNALNFNFDQFSAGETRRIVAGAAGGGVVAVRMLNAVACGGTGRDDWMFDFDTTIGNGTIVFEQVRLENGGGTVGCKQFLRMAGFNQIVVRGLEESQLNQSETMFRVLGGNLTIQDSRIASHDARKPTILLSTDGTGQDSALILERVHFDCGRAPWLFSEWIQCSSVNDRCQITLRDCTYGTAKRPLPFINNRIEAGRVRVVGKTAGASGTRLTVTGQSSDTENFYGRPRIPSRWAGFVDAFIVGRQTDGPGQATMHRRFSLIADAAGKTAMGTVQTMGTDDNKPAYPVPAFAIDPARQTVDVVATGLAATTIAWVVEYDFHGSPLAYE